MSDWSLRLRGALACANRASQLALTCFDDLRTLEMIAKGPQDLVSRADIEVEQTLRSSLAELFPGEAILGEELGGEPISNGWVLDPIDGTGNFLRGSPLWGIAIAYLVAGEPVVAVIAYPALRFTLAAACGTGLLLNGQPFVRPQPPEHLRIIGIGENTLWPAHAIGELELVLRRAGWGLAGYRCATIGLGFAALGHIDGYLERYTSLWDIAAGALLCKEAGLIAKIQGEQIAGGMSVMAGSEALMSLAIGHFR